MRDSQLSTSYTPEVIDFDNDRPPEPVHTILVSDVHLGSPVSRSTDLLKFLQRYQVNKHEYRFKQLILLGDIFDDLNFKRLKKHSWELVGLFRQITDEESNAEVKWLLGNHDRELAHLMTHLVGVDVYTEYEWEVANRRFLALHGDRFDMWIVRFPQLVNIPCWIYSTIQNMDGRKQRISRFVKNRSKTWLRINKKVAAGMMNYARSLDRKIDAAFCGHTHIAEAIEYPDDNMWYYNTGCWTGRQSPTYVTVGYDGRVNLCELRTEASPAIQPIAAG